MRELRNPKNVVRGLIAPEVADASKRFRRGVFRSVKELEAAIREYIDVHNEVPPFVWTRTADQVLDSMARYTLVG